MRRCGAVAITVAPLSEAALAQKNAELRPQPFEMRLPLAQAQQHFEGELRAWSLYGDSR